METAIAATLLTLFLTSLFALNSTVMRMLRSAAETTCASQELQTRIEQVRLVNWRQISQSGTTASARGTAYNILAAPTDALGDLPGISERLDAILYRDPLVFDSKGNVVLPAASFSVLRDANGVLTVKDGNGGNATTSVNLSAEDKLFVRVAVTWTSWGGRVRTRELVTVVSRWGISK